MLPRNDQTQYFQYARLLMTYKIANEKVGITEKGKQSRHMLEKTERAVNNGQFRDTGTIGYTRHRTKKKPDIVNTYHKVKVYVFNINPKYI